MSARETAAQREARMMRAAAGREELPPLPPPRRLPMVRTRPVRTTVDMTPELHRLLKGWLLTAAADLDVTAVPLADVMRVLVRRLVEDDALAAVVLEDLRALD
jgi:hypothetical protein